MGEWFLRPVTTLVALSVIFGLTFGASRLYDLVVPRAEGCIRPWSAHLGVGVVALLMTAFFASGLGEQLRRGGMHGILWPEIQWPVGGLAVSGIAGGLLIHFALTTRTWVAPDRLIFKCWLQPRLEVPMSEVVGSEMTPSSRRYRVCLIDGRRIEILVSADGIGTLQDVLRAAGKATPTDKELAAAISRERMLQ
jgi:hypothetical protein